MEIDPFSLSNGLNVWGRTLAIRHTPKHRLTWMLDPSNRGAGRLAGNVGFRADVSMPIFTASDSLQFINTKPLENRPPTAPVAANTGSRRLECSASNGLNNIQR